MLCVVCPSVFSVRLCGHMVYPNPFDIICPYLDICITPCIFYGGEIGISEHSSVQSKVLDFPIVSAEAPLQTRVIHRPHTLLCGNLGGAFCCGKPYIPFFSQCLRRNTVPST